MRPTMDADARESEERGGKGGCVACLMNVIQPLYDCGMTYS